MLFIRSLIFLLGQAFTAVIVYLLGMLLFPFPYRVRYHFITSWSHFVIWWAKIICNIRYEVQGKSNLNIPNGIILCNHQSAWETLFLQTILGPQSWVLKKELLYIPFFGWGLSMLEPIAIDRRKASSLKQLIDQGKKYLNDGRWVVIFPEGSRIAVGKKAKYSRSGAVLSKESGYPIVPIAHNAGLLWPKNAFIKKPGTIQVMIGPAVYPQEWCIDEIHQTAKHWIEDNMPS